MSRLGSLESRRFKRKRADDPSSFPASTVPQEFKRIEGGEGEDTCTLCAKNVIIINNVV